VRRAKIIATLGPALDDPVRLRAAIEAGADVFRFNFSHGSLADHRDRVELVRQLGAQELLRAGAARDVLERWVVASQRAAASEGSSAQAG
jgi:pyruvate kinase